MYLKHVASRAVKRSEDDQLITHGNTHEALRYANG
jgi:hypothetical protein